MGNDAVRDQGTFFVREGSLTDSFPQSVLLRHDKIICLIVREEHA